MRVDVWADLVCPFCFLGRRQLQLALESFEHADQVELVWHSFELDEHAPRVESEGLPERLAAKYGMSVAEATERQESIAAAAAELGLVFNWREAKPGNTFDAHRLIHLAAGHGLADALVGRFMQAYFSQGQAIGEPDVLRPLAVEVGLDRAAVDEVLDSTAFTDEVRADEATARRVGASGVPFFVLAEKYAVSGAQPAEVLLQALRQAWQEA